MAENKNRGKPRKRTLFLTVKNVSTGKKSKIPIFKKHQQHLDSASNGSEFIQGPPHIQVSADSFVQDIRDDRLYSQRKQSEVNRWKALRSPLLDLWLGRQGKHMSLSCGSCGENLENDIYQCMDCNLPSCCNQCIIKLHSRGVFHDPQKWTGQTFIKYSNEGNGHIFDLPGRSDHTACMTEKVAQVVTVFDHLGRRHVRRVYLCPCQPDFIQLMVDHDLWAATPERPNVVYHNRLMDLLISLTMECHLPVKGFCEAIALLNHLSSDDMKTLKRMLQTETVHEYMLFKESETAFLQKTKTTVCPACPKEQGRIVIAIDGNFGLTRKKSSGTSYEDPVINSIFLNSDTVKDFMVSYSTDAKSRGGDCNRFQAGDALRSKNQSSKLDVTGVFGSACKHEVPKYFLDLYGGERIGYSVLVLDKLLDELSSTDVGLNLMYDIACVLEAHLKKTEEGRQRLEKVKLAIPIFHCYGHKAACQIEYSPRRLNGFGLADGEVMERVWAYLRRFAKITKEMTPSHRVDLLSSALLYYGRKKVKTIDKTLVERNRKSSAQAEVAEQELLKLYETINVPVEQRDVQHWEHQEQLMIKAKRELLKKGKSSKDWEEKYVTDLMTYNALQAELGTSSAEDSVVLAKKIKSLDKSLKKTEMAKTCSKRWATDSDVFREIEERLENKKREDLLSALRSTAMEREFLRKMKEQCSGQKTAGRVSRQMQKVTRDLTKILNQYNGRSLCPIRCADRYPRIVQFEAAKDPQSSLYNILETDELATTTIPFSQVRQIVDLVHRRRSALEETDLCVQEMYFVVEHFIMEHNYLMQQYENNTENSGKSRVIYDAIIRIEQRLNRAVLLFSTFCNDLPSLTKFISDIQEGNLQTNNSDSEDDLEDEQEDEDVEFIDFTESSSSIDSGFGSL